MQGILGVVHGQDGGANGDLAGGCVGAPCLGAPCPGATVSAPTVSAPVYIYIGVSLFFASAETFFSEFLYFILFNRIFCF